MASEMEQCMSMFEDARLDVQVALTRKGFKNQIKTLLWRNRSATSTSILSSATSNGAAEPPATPMRTPRATTSSVFSGLSGSQVQLRQLADTAFLIQDFETAASTLRTLAVDYRSEKLWHSYASVQVCPRGAPLALRAAASLALCGCQA